jgi:Cd2+/Zn2+-exporting ATPase
MAATSQAEAKSLSWKVGGMDCASCATKIRGAVERLPGVSDVKLSVMSETLTLSLDAGSTTPEAIEKRVNGLGYTTAALAKAPVEKPAAKGNCCDHDHHDHDHGGHARDHAGHEHGDACRSDHAHDHDHAHGHNHAGHDHGPTATKAAAAKDHGHGLPGHVHEVTPDGARWYQTGKGRLVIGTGLLLGAAYAVRLLWADIGHWAFILACIVGVLPVAKRALAATRAGIPFTIEMLMTIAAIGALFIGAAEEAALVVFLFAVGEVLEGVAADRARASIRALGDLVPKTALVEENGATRQVDAASLKIGQIVLVRPGDRIPADGAITDGISGIDESPVTGESVP